ncbi:carboxypeptidase-like regulatory domain-containing protein [Bernardetia sp.]|uniref:carboxypeptidase-like regulatory domain-containing protein n=1 Tax=Bernardetia sp. TaxID=1937974 RepID=UPI0025C72BD3|nr:carboxypeptidase-like regulatory domain-containing protein [Bernardetia sp.]
MKKVILSLLFILSFSYATLGQILVKGKVISDYGALPGAIVQVKETDRSTITDIEGRFLITVENKDDILIFRCVGYETKEMTASKIGKNKNIVLLEQPVLDHPTISYPLIINYWSGVLYNPYGISISKTRRFYSLNFNIDFDFGYGTNFKENQDFYCKVGTDILKKVFYYKFQQTTFEDLDVKNIVTTHSLISKSNLKPIKTELLYGIGYQKFLWKGVENDKSTNFGVHLEVSKYIHLIRFCISAKSFYWQEYWAWEANLNRKFYYEKLELNTGISYRQIAQDFKEVNLTLGYIF